MTRARELFDQTISEMERQSKAGWPDPDFVNLYLLFKESSIPAKTRALVMCYARWYGQAAGQYTSLADRCCCAGCIGYEELGLWGCASSRWTEDEFGVCPVEVCRIWMIVDTYDTEFYGSSFFSTHIAEMYGTLVLHAQMDGEDISDIPLPNVRQTNAAQ